MTLSLTFQLTAARRRLGPSCVKTGTTKPFQLTAARRRLALAQYAAHEREDVSTHSRPKAAGCIDHVHPKSQGGFNSQPPEGGWFDRHLVCAHPRGVSTHSRPKAAGRPSEIQTAFFYRFNSQPPEGGWTRDVLPVPILPVFQLTAARRRLGIQ